MLLLSWERPAELPHLLLVISLASLGWCQLPREYLLEFQVGQPHVTSISKAAKAWEGKDVVPEGSSLTPGCSCLSSSLLLQSSPGPLHPRSCCVNMEEGTKGMGLAIGYRYRRRQARMCTHTHAHTTHMHTDPGFICISSTPAFMGKNISIFQAWYFL